MQGEEIALAIPSALQQHLEDDCYWISRKEKLVSLPRSPTVSQILTDFYHYYCDQHNPAATDINIPLLREVLDGLKIYFDFTLKDHLLYASELSQYKSVMEDSSLPPSSVYGAEHLLRLFVRIPQFLCQANMSTSLVQILYHHFKELFTYLISRKTELFSESHYNNITERTSCS